MALIDNILAYWNLNDDGSGGVSLVDSTGNSNTLTNNNGVALGTGIIAGDAVFNGANNLSSANTLIPSPSGDFSISLWANTTAEGSYFSSAVSGANSLLIQDFSGTTYVQILNNGSLIGQLNATSIRNAWVNYVFTYNASGNSNWYQNGLLVDSGNYLGIGTDPNGGLWLGKRWDGYNLTGQLDEVGIWNRVLSPTEVTFLYNGGAGYAYPFPQSPTATLYYNNAQNDGDWGSLLNWWQDSGFTLQATALPTATNPINLYNQVTQNTQGANQCFCASASFWSANFGVGLTLQASGVVNMQGTSLLAGTTTDGVSMHDSSQLTPTSVVDGNVTMRDSSRAFGTILGNATIYYDGGNGQYPIGGTVGGTVTYVGWPAVSPQWFNDQATGGGNNGDFSDLENWWSDDTYTTRPLSPITGQQYLPDASTDVFIAPNTGITANSGTANPTVNSVTANNSNIQNISITATNGFLFSGNEGAQNATLYGSVTFQDTAYNDNSVIQGTVTYKSAASLQNSWNQNSLGNLNSGASVGSTGFVVNISSGGGGGGTISRLLNLPWFINI